MSFTRNAITLTVLVYAIGLTHVYWGNKNEVAREETPQAESVASVFVASSSREATVPDDSLPATPIQNEVLDTQVESPAPLPQYTTATLAAFNGEDATLPIYIALEGNVYDVSLGKKFYAPGGAYHFLAGTDGTKLLAIFGGDTIKKKYPIVGIFSP